MEVCKVKGLLVATRKDVGIKGYKLLTVTALNPEDLTPKGLNMVAVDIVDAGIGDIVLVVRGSSARVATGLKGKPVDAAIIGVIDELVMGGRTIYKKNNKKS